MRHTFWKCNYFIPILTGLLLISCNKPIPTEQPAEAPSIPAELPPNPLRDLACESVIDVDLKKAAENADIYDKHILWTVHMNFMAFENNDIQNPLGCFRLYALNEDAGEFVPIDAGGLIIDTCQVGGEATFDMTEVSSSNLQRSSVKTGIAHLNNEWFIVCEGLSIKQMTIDVINFVSGGTGIGPILTSIGINNGENATSIAEEYELLVTQDYHENIPLTLIAGGSVLRAGDESSSLIYYEPIDSTNSVPPVAMAILPQADNNSGEFYAFVENDEYKSDSNLPPDPEAPVSDPNCRSIYGTDYYWWTDLNLQRATKLEFTKRELGAADLQLCTSITPDTNQISSARIWTGPANLYIACDPNTIDDQGVCQSGLNGTLFGIMLDPLNSKPQAG